VEAAFPVHVVSRRELGAVRRYRASGVSAGSLLASHAAVGAVLGATASAVVLLVGGAAYGVPAPDDPLAVAGAIPFPGMIRKRSRDAPSSAWRCARWVLGGGAGAGFAVHLASNVTIRYQPCLQVPVPPIPRVEADACFGVPRS